MLRKNPYPSDLPHIAQQSLQQCQKQLSPRKPRPKLKFPFGQNKKKLQHYKSLQKLNAHTTKPSLDSIDHTATIPCNQVYIYLQYKNSKIQLEFPWGTPLKLVAQNLYKKIVQFETTVLRLAISDATQEAQKVLGFSSQDMDLQFDYLLSIAMEAGDNVSEALKENLKLKKSKFLKTFAKKQNHNKQINYKICQCLAIGGFSKVYLARSYTDGKFYAIKFIKKSFDENDPRSRTTKQKTKDQIQIQKEKFLSLQNEIDIAKEINHPFLIKLSHAFETESLYGLVFQYCPGGELFYLLKKRRIFTQNEARFYFLQILYGLSFLHEHSIIYRDLKPQNILIDWSGNLKIVDYGLSKKVSQLKNKQKSFSYCGSAEYMAPEMIMRTGHSFSLDYYSLGALLYELVTGLPPFYTKDQHALQESILFEDINFPKHIQLSSQIKDLLNKLLQKEQKFRLGSLAGLKEILFHPWIGRVNSKDILDKKPACPYPPNLDDHNFDPNQLGQDEATFTKCVKKQVFDLQKTQQKNKRQIGVRSQQNSFYIEKKQKRSNDSPDNCSRFYKKTFYQSQSLSPINSRFVELVRKQLIEAEKQQLLTEFNNEQSESRAMLKPDSLTKLSSFSTHRPNKYALKFRQTQNKTTGEMMEIQNRKSLQNFSLDKIEEKENFRIKGSFLPSFSHEKRPNSIIEEIEKIKKQHYRQKKPKYDQRLFNNLKNTYLSSSFQKKYISNNTEMTLRGSSNHQSGMKTGSLAKLKKIIPRKVLVQNQNESVIIRCNEQMKNLLQTNDREGFSNNKLMDEEKVYVAKKKIFRGSKIVLNQGGIKKNEILH